MIEIRPATREVVIGPRHLLEVGGAVVGDLNWLGPPPVPGRQLGVQIRYRAPVHRCTVEEIDDDAVGLSFRGGAMAVAPGQSSVFFEGERVLGGGRIRETVGRR